MQSNIQGTVAGISGLQVFKSWNSYYVTTSFPTIRSDLTMFYMITSSYKLYYIDYMGGTSYTICI